MPARRKLTFEALIVDTSVIDKRLTARIHVEGAKPVDRPPKLRTLVGIIDSNPKAAVKIVRNDPAAWLPLLMKHEPRWTLARRGIREVLYLLFWNAEHGSGFVAHESRKLLSNLLPKRRVGGGGPHTTRPVIRRAYKKRLAEVHEVVSPTRRERIRRMWSELKREIPDELKRIRHIGQEFYDLYGAQLRFGDIRAALAPSIGLYVTKWIAKDFGMTPDYVRKIIRKSRAR